MWWKVRFLAIISLFLGINIGTWCGIYICQHTQTLDLTMMINWNTIVVSIAVIGLIIKGE